jgi:hypothetical protein
MTRRNAKCHRKAGDPSIGNIVAILFNVQCIEAGQSKVSANVVADVTVHVTGGGRGDFATRKA